MKKLAVLIISGIEIAGCSEKTYTVKEFEDDATLRTKFVEKCKNGELHPEDLNCINALKVDFLIETRLQMSGEKF